MLREVKNLSTKANSNIIRIGHLNSWIVQGIEWNPMVQVSTIVPFIVHDVLYLNIYLIWKQNRILLSDIPDWVDLVRPGLIIAKNPFPNSGVEINSVDFIPSCSENDSSTQTYYYDKSENYLGVHLSTGTTIDSTISTYNCQSRNVVSYIKVTTEKKT